MYHTGDTIVAIGTAPGGAARGMVRISGPEAVPIVAARFSADDDRPLSEIRRATALLGKLRVVVDARAGDSRAQSVDCRLMLWPDQRSFTRQPVAELHTVGSPPILDAIVQDMCRRGARLAQPGEFTLRAFLAGRIDLTQAEAVLGVIDARGQDQFLAALAQLAGGLGRPLAALRKDLLQLLAELEAGLDFVDEDIEIISAEAAADRLTEAHRQLAALLKQLVDRGVFQARCQVVLTGAPNAGKSSLFNALAARWSVSPDGPAAPILQAIVSPLGGTTRDFVTAAVALDGITCELVDTAGVAAHSEGPDAALRLASNASIDDAAQAAAIGQRTAAPIRLWCVDATVATSDRAVRELVAQVDPMRDLVVLTKIDLVGGGKDPSSLSDVPAIATSSRTGEGLVELHEAVAKLLAGVPWDGGIAISATAARCRESIRAAAEAVRRAEDCIRQSAGNELVSAEIRSALAELGQVVGAVYTEDLLDRIFSTFCIGK